MLRARTGGSRLIAQLLERGEVLALRELTAITAASTIVVMQQLELWTGSHHEETAALTTDVAGGELASASPQSLVEQPSVACLSPDPLFTAYMEAARSDRTRAAYANDWRLFERWCAERREQALPASTVTLGHYLVHLAQQGRKASTIRRARIAIGVVHSQCGLHRPDQDPRVRTLERGIGRVHGRREEGATPLLVPELERMVSALGHSVRDDRDRAMLLLGFAGAFRSSELVGLDFADVELGREGLRVRLRHSKSDPLGEGATAEIPPGQNPLLCPVASLSQWLAQLSGGGPIFPAVHGSRVVPRRLKPRAVTRVVERAAHRAGLPDEYSSHSLRSGLATSARLAGRDPRDIQAHGRWQDLRSLGRYDSRASAAAARRAIAGLL